MIEEFSVEFIWRQSACLGLKSQRGENRDRPSLSKFIYPLASISNSDSTTSFSHHITMSTPVGLAVPTKKQHPESEVAEEPKDTTHTLSQRYLSTRGGSYGV